MLIGIFAIIISLFTMFESPFLLKNSDKLIKKHIVDQSRKEKLLIHINEAKDQRKLFVKNDKKLTKKINKLYKLRETTSQEFADLIDQSTSSRKQMQEANFKLTMESQDLITEFEWENIKPDFKKGMMKIAKKISKSKISTNKSFDKIEAKFKKTIKDEQKAKDATKALKDFKVSVNNMFEEYKNEILSESSILYELIVEEQMVIKLQKNHMQNIENVLNAYANLHAVLVASTTEKEWKKLYRSFKLPK